MTEKTRYTIANQQHYIVVLQGCEGRKYLGGIYTDEETEKIPAVNPDRWPMLVGRIPVELERVVK